jgi:hypothetical protein
MDTHYRSVVAVLLTDSVLAQLPDNKTGLMTRCQSSSADQLVARLADLGLFYQSQCLNAAQLRDYSTSSSGTRIIDYYESHMSVLEAVDRTGGSTAQLLTASVSSLKQQHPILKRLTKLMDSAGDETDADSESLELALLDVELTKYAAHEGILLGNIPAAATPSTSAGGSSIAQQLSTVLVSPNKYQHVKPKPMQSGTMLQLVQQQSKFLDVLQCMIDKSVSADKPQQRRKSSTSTVVQASSTSAATAANTAGEHGVEPAVGLELEEQQQLSALQVQYERQVADNHALKRRCLKVQKAILKHLQAARAQAAAAEAAAEDAHRWVWRHSTPAP